jgi:hypothetical protein
VGAAGDQSLAGSTSPAIVRERVAGGRRREGRSQTAGTREMIEGSGLDMD